MELGIQNFTQAGNNLSWRGGWENYQAKECKSKTSKRIANKVHYQRILNTLTDTRSIDVLNEPSLKNVKKIGGDAFLIKYIQENSNSKSIQDLVTGLGAALGIPPSDNRYRNLYARVVEEMNIIHSATDSMTRIPYPLQREQKNVGSQGNPQQEQEIQQLISYGDKPIPYSMLEMVKRNFPSFKNLEDRNGELYGQIPSKIRKDGSLRYYVLDEILGDDLVKVQEVLAGSGAQREATIDVSIDQQTVPIVATDAGVSAEGNQVSLTLPSGSLAGEDNTRLTRVPEQFSAPTDLPPQVRRTTFSRFGVPDTNELASQTDITGEYPNSQFALQMKPFSPTNVKSRYPKDPIRSQYLIGGMPQGKAPEMEDFYQFGDPERTRYSRETNTLLTGPTGEMRATGKGRPPLVLAMDYSGAEGSASEATFATASTGGSFSVLGGPSRPPSGDIRTLFPKK